MLSRILIGIAAAAAIEAFPANDAFIQDMPDYAWHSGCFGSASGNMMGYWDRNGFPDFYTGPTAGGVAPLNSNSSSGNDGIRSLWASEAGFDGRPVDKPGHLDDYWDYYEATTIDPYVRAGRAEHEPDCTGDFMGSSQNKFTDLNGECTGNIDAFAFNYWDKTGARRHNFVPPVVNGIQVRDIQSGYRNWAESRGNKAEVFSQLVEFNPEVPAGAGFTFDDLKAEIDAGYPVMLFLQDPNRFSRALTGMPKANPIVHGMIAYGYRVTEIGNLVFYRTSWASGDFSFARWENSAFEVGLNLRGVILFHPLPQIRKVEQTTDGLKVRWDGPSSNVLEDGTQKTVHWYVVEKSESLDSENFTPITEPTTSRATTIPNCCDGNAFYRVKLLDRSQIPQ